MSGLQLLLPTQIAGALQHALNKEINHFQFDVFSVLFFVDTFRPRLSFLQRFNLDEDPVMFPFARTP